MDVVPKLIAAFLLATCVLFTSQMPAVGHTSLVSTDPADGSQIPTAPPSVQLTFSEDIETAFIAGVAPDGSKVTTGEPRIIGTKVVAELAASDQRGTFTVAYRVVSGDGHALTGQFRFTATEGRTVAEADSSDSESFVERNSTAVGVGLALALVAIALMLAPLTRRRRGA